MIYVCENNVCHLPVDDVKEAIKQISKWSLKILGKKWVFDSDSFSVFISTCFR
jgi:hypothetical protein